MPNVMLVLVIILALMLWRSVFAVLHRRTVLRETGPHPHYENALRRRFRILERAYAGVIAENGVDLGSDEVCLSDGRSRANSFLRRIVALTGARRMGNRYILKVGKTIFHVRDRYVWRLPDSTNPECGYNETCFYPVHKGMPREEEIAAALLQPARTRFAGPAALFQVRSPCGIGRNQTSGKRRSRNQRICKGVMRLGSVHRLCREPRK